MTELQKGDRVKLSERGIRFGIVKKKTTLGTVVETFPHLPVLVQIMVDGRKKSQPFHVGFWEKAE